MKTDYERAKARTLKEFRKLLNYYNEAVLENDEEDINDFKQQLYAVQRVLSVAFKEYHSLNER